MKDHYRILDLSPDATQQQIKDRYRQLVRIFHPDRYPKPEDKIYAEQKLQEINQAYEAIQGGDARGLRLSTDTRPPKPVVYPAHIDLGSVVQGERAYALLQIDNLGGFAQSLSFHMQEGANWFAITKGERLDPSKPLPMLLHIEARTESLNVGETVENWLDIDVHGVRARATLRMEVVDRSSAAYRPGRIVSMMAAIAVLLTVVYVVWNLLGPASADTAALPPSSTTVLETAGSVDGQAHAALAAIAPAEATTTSGTEMAESNGQESTGGVLRVANHPASAGDAPAGTPASNESLEPIQPVVAAAAQPTMRATATSARAAIVVPAATDAPEPEAQSSPASAVAVAAEPSATPTASATLTPMPSPSPSPVPTATPTRTAIATAVSIPAQISPPSGLVTISVPLDYQINARADTSVESPSLALLDKGATFPAIARTLDNAWTQIVLQDGRTAWVFTASMVADLAAIGTLPVSVDLLNVAPSAYVQSGDGSSGETAQPAVPDPETEETSGDVDAGDREEAAETLFSTHRVEAGDYLKQLALRYYGDEEQWGIIYAANVEVIGPDPNLLPAGVELTIPTQ